MSLSKREIESLLPFLANGTLEDEEHIQVEAEVAKNLEYAAELATLRAIRTTMQAAEVEFSPGDLGLARLMREVKNDPMQQQNRPSSRVWQFAAAALFALVVGQGALMINWIKSGSNYELADGVSADLVITVKPSVTEEKLRETLLDAGVGITAGPSALGIYELSVVDGVVLEEAVEVLKAATKVVETLKRAN
jgi:hypothetical protein